MNRKLTYGVIRKYAALCAAGGILMQVIPFACGQNILRTVTPVLLDDTYNVLDWVIRLVAPLVLP